MSNSTKPFMTFKEAFMSVYLPGILIFLGIIAGATCVSVGPFFPVGIAGIVAIACIILIAVSLAKKQASVNKLEDTLLAKECVAENVAKRNASDLANKDVIISELKENITNLQLKVNDLTNKAKELKKKCNEPVKIVAEEKPIEEKPVEKKTARKRK